MVVGGNTDDSVGWFVDPTVLEVDDPHSPFITTAGNLYVNDKPTGSVVGAPPFGGARASGTNDKAGTVWNLIRFASPRSVKRNHLPATDYRYPHLDR